MGLIALDHLLENLRHVVKVLKQNDVPPQARHKRGDHRSFRQVIEGSSKLMNQVAPSRGATVRSACLDRSHRFYFGEGTGNFDRGPGPYPTWPDHSNLEALLSQIIDGRFAGVSVGPLNEEGILGILHPVFLQEGIILATEDAIEVIGRLLDHPWHFEEGSCPLCVHGGSLVGPDLRTV